MNLAAAQHWAAQRLAAAGIDSAPIDARVLLQYALHLSPGAMIAARDRPLSAAARRAVEALVERRAARTPLAYIVRCREFWSLDFCVVPGVLIPRPDSETLVEAALEALPPDRPARVLDLGTGSGCLLLAVLSERPLATGVGADLDPRAAAVARLNAHRLGLAGRAAFVVSDWAAAVAGPFDLVLCNPPYIPTGDFDSLMPEVADHEPRLALDGGAAGLDAYARLCPQLPPLLTAHGRVLFELGAGQGAAVARLAAAAGLDAAPPRPDLTGVPRCLTATLAPDRQKKAWPGGN